MRLNGAERTLNYPDNSLLEWIRLNNVEQVKVALAQSPMSLYVYGNWGETPLHLAANIGAVECLRVLLEANAHVNEVDREKRTPLFHACANGHEECVKVLIDYCAEVNPSVRGMYGASPLHAAVSGRHPACVSILRNAGANLEARSNSGFTPLGIAIRSDNQICGELLLGAGANHVDSTSAKLLPEPAKLKWVNDFFERQAQKKACVLLLMGVLRKRFRVAGVAPTDHLNRVPYDLIRMMASHVFRSRWPSIEHSQSSSKK